MTLVIPKLTRVSIIDAGGGQVRVPGIAVGVHCFATYRNDYHLGPFITDESGVSRITRESCEVSASAVIDADLMGHSRIETCRSGVEIFAWDRCRVESAAKARASWGLCGREPEIWSSAEELIDRIRSAPNGRTVRFIDSAAPADWGGDQDEVSVVLVASLQGS